MTSAAGPATSVVARALRVLAAFDAGHRVLTLTQISARAALPLTTAHRLVAQLTEWEALVRRPDGSYVVGRRIWDLGLLAPVNAELRQVAAPYLHDLYGATKATVQLAQRDGTQTLYLESLTSHTSVPVVNRVGGRLPLHATGVGKVLLAHAPGSVQATVLRSLHRVTPYTITRPDQLRAQLAQIARDGLAQTSEEMSLGACSLAVPIVGVDGAVVAALGLVVATLSRERSRLVTALRGTARGISQGLAAA